MEDKVKVDVFSGRIDIVPLDDFHCLDTFIEMIAKQACKQTFAGCQFLTVEALATNEYSAVGFYQRCGFSANETKKPYKDTLRMFRTLYASDEA